MRAESTTIMGRLIKDFRILLVAFERTIVLGIRNTLGFRRKKKKEKSRIYRVKWLDGFNGIKKQELKGLRPGVSCSPRRTVKRLLADVQVPAVNLYCMSNAACFGESSFFLKEGNVLLERIPIHDGYRCCYSNGMIRRIGYALAVVTRGEERVIEKGIFMGGNGSANYYHWMVELLPKLEFVENLPAEYDRFPLLVDESIAKIPTLHEALICLAKGREVIFLQSGACYQVGCLLHINSPSIAPFNILSGADLRATDFLTRESSVYYVRESLMQGLLQTDDGSRFPKRLFLARKDGRRNYNQAEVFDIFKPMGFSEIYPEDYSLGEQIRIFSEAEMIAGPSGAAWTNLMFCKAGVTAVCWADEQLEQLCSFSNLAYCVGADLHYVFYPTHLKSIRDFYATDYTVNVADIRETVDAVMTG